MKNISKLIFFSLMLAVTMWSCTKEETMDYYDGGTAPVLSSTSPKDIPMSYATASLDAITFNWTNPNYKFTTGVSSQNVNYVLEIDTVGANFTNPNKKSIGITSDVSLTIIQSVLNDYLLNQLQLTASHSHKIQMRVKSTLGNGSVALISNVLDFTVTPYAIPPKVNPPTSGQLFLVGDATAGGWTNPVPVPAQEFTQVSATLYEIIVPLVGGKEYLFLPKNGDWSHKFACKDKTLAGLNGGGDFGYDFNDNFPGPSASGNYKIQVDFQRGKFVVTAQ